MNIVWLSWKDRTHPQAGGAETVSGEIMDRLVRDGHAVRHITVAYDAAKYHEIIQGVEIYRVGNRYSVYWKAWRLFKQQPDWADVVVDEMNTVPFASGLYAHKRNVLLSYQLARSVWFYQMPLPLSLIGYLIEPLYLRLIASRYPVVLTESESTKHDLMRYGFKERRIHVFRIGMELQPVRTVQNKTRPKIVLSLGAVRPMKRTLHAVKAFEIARDQDQQLQLVVAGDVSTPYAHKVQQYIKRSRHASAITVLGRVTPRKRLELMRQAAIILVTSVKEGWGLVVTEANSQGTPAIVYDADGLRDSVQDGKTGIVVADSNVQAMGNAVTTLLRDPKQYAKLREQALAWSHEFTFENSYHDFLKAISN